MYTVTFDLAFDQMNTLISLSPPEAIRTLRLRQLEHAFVGRGRRDKVGAAFGKLRTPCMIEDDVPSKWRL